MENKVSIFWFRRDLRLEDNKGLHEALQSGNKVVPLFIFDKDILESLPKNDARVTFIYQTLQKLDKELREYRSSLIIKKGKPLEVWRKLVEEYTIQGIYTNKDYEPYATKRDKEIADFLTSKGIRFNAFKDQVIFEQNEVLKNDGTPYTVFTPYKNKWLQNFSEKKDTQDFTIDFVYSGIVLDWVVGVIGIWADGQYRRTVCFNYGSRHVGGWCHCGDRVCRSAHARRNAT